MVSVVSGLVLTLLSVPNVRDRLIVVLIFLSRLFCYLVGMSLSVEHVLVIIVQ